MKEICLRFSSSYLPLATLYLPLVTMTLACTVIRQQFVSTVVHITLNNFTSFLLFSFSSAWITIESELIISTMKLQSATIGWWNQEFMMIALIWLTGFSKGFELQTSWGDLVCKKCNLKNVGGRVSKNEVRSQEPRAFSLRQSFLYPKSDNVSETFWLH